MIKLLERPEIRTEVIDLLYGRYNSPRYSWRFILMPVKVECDETINESLDYLELPFENSMFKLYNCKLITNENSKYLEYSDIAWTSNR